MSQRVSLTFKISFGSGLFLSLLRELPTEKQGVPSFLVMQATKKEGGPGYRIRDITGGELTLVLSHVSVGADLATWRHVGMWHPVPECTCTCTHMHPCHVPTHT